MGRQLQLPLLLVAGLVAFGGVSEPAFAQIGRAVKKATRRPPRSKPNQGILPGNPRPGARPNAGAAANANLMIERLVLMPTDQRNQFLEKDSRFKRLPKRQQQRIQQRLQQIDNMPPAQRQSLMRRFRYFSSLPAPEQRQARRDYSEWQKLSRQRRQDLTYEARQLFRASPERRQQRVDSAAFATAYNATERRIIELLVAVRSTEP